MVAFLGGAAILLIIAVAVLHAPVTLDMQVAKAADSPTLDFSTRLRWLGLDIPIGGAPAAKPHPPVRHPRRRRVGTLLWSPGFLSRTARLAGDLAVVARPRRLALDARVGFDDPSDTGILLAAMSFRSLAVSGYKVRIEPDFAREVLAGSLRVRWSGSIAAVTWPVLKYLASPVVWRAVRIYRASDRRRSQ